jgi:hypothetical protein
MTGDARVEQEQSEGRARSPLRRALFIAVLVFAAIVGTIAVTAVFSGDRQSLEFDYEGFD